MRPPRYAVRMRLQMILLSVLLVGAADLGAPFVDASAEASRVTGGIEVELEVELNVSVATVVAHVVIPGDEQQTVTLSARGGGTYGGLVTVPAADLVVIFEAVDVSRDVLSQPVTLTELGVDPDVFQSDRTFALPAESSRTVTPGARRWLWAATAMGAASLALIAWWAAGPRRPESDDVAQDTVED